MRHARLQSSVWPRREDRHSGINLERVRIDDLCAGSFGDFNREFALRDGGRTKQIKCALRDRRAHFPERETNRIQTKEARQNGEPLTKRLSQTLSRGSELRAPCSWRH